MAFTVSGMDSNSFNTLFSGFNTGANSSLYGAISDYNSIKSGSYGKLLGAYYREMGSSSVSSSKESTGTDRTSRGYYEQYLAQQKTKSTSSDKSASTVSANSTQQTTSKVASSAQNMVDSLDTLRGSDLYKKTGSAYDTEKIYSAVSSFVDSYNSTIDNASKVASSNSLSVSSMNSNISSMQSTTAAYSKQLANVGITVGQDGRLSVDKEAFTGADMSQVQSLFGKGGYGNSVRTNAYMSNYYAKQTMNNTSTYAANGGVNMSDLVSTYATSV